MWPVIFVPIYLILGLLSTILGASNPEIWLGISLVLSIFHGTWVWQAALYALRKGSHRNDSAYVARRIQKLKRLAIFDVIAMALSILLFAFRNALPTWIGGIFAPAALGVFAFLWLSAKSVDEAEIAPGSRNLVLEPLGTFLHLIYIFIGAFFVYRRLKRLELPYLSS